MIGPLRGGGIKAEGTFKSAGKGARKPNQKDKEAPIINKNDEGAGSHNVHVLTYKCHKKKYTILKGLSFPSHVLFVCFFLHSDASIVSKHGVSIDGRKRKISFC